MRLTEHALNLLTIVDLNHPNIAAIYGIEERAIVMELELATTAVVPHGNFATEPRQNWMCSALMNQPAKALRIGRPQITKTADFQSDIVVNG